MRTTKIAWPGVCTTRPVKSDVFLLNTAVQPENQHPIAHSHIEREFAAGHVEIHELPKDFQARLQKAVQDSDAFSGGQRARLRPLIA